jgi:hypothetical protein
MSESNLGKWDVMYASADKPAPYGDVTTYILGAAWLKGLDVEDWGCGLTWMAQYVDKGYVGIDGSHAKGGFSVKIEDLAMYKSKTPGLFMRHVLEHNYDWKQILNNAIASFEKRMVLVIFTPFAYNGETYTLAEGNYNGVEIPDISFGYRELVRPFHKFLVNEEHIATKTQYGQEHVFYLERT